MSERRNEFESGSATLQQFFYWINERHRIWINRNNGLPKPWTTDPVLRDFKFTNVFRELDRGTLALRKMEAGQTDPALLIFNTWWYRLFNWHEHATNLGFVDSYDKLHDYMIGLHNRGGRIFTAAHMVRGIGGQAKVFPYLKLSKYIWDDRLDLAEIFSKVTTQQEAMRTAQLYYLMGDFTSYEVVCDLRWHVLKHCTDALAWGNVGNGAVRGLKRLGYKPTVESMVALWELAKLYLEPHVIDHHPGVSPDPLWPPFELREIEHSLCEFDKYMRAVSGVGRPKERFNGKG